MILISIKMILLSVLACTLVVRGKHDEKSGFRVSLNIDK